MNELESVEQELLELQTLIGEWTDDAPEWSPEWMERQSLLQRQADLLHERFLLSGELDLEVFLQGQTVHNRTVEAGFVGGFLERLQTTLTAIIHEMMGEAGSRGSFSEQVLSASTLELVSTGVGSFRLGLSQQQGWLQTEMWPDDSDEAMTPLDEAIERLTRLIDSGQLDNVDSESLGPAVAGLGGHRAVARVVDLSNFVGQSGTAARLVHRKRFGDRPSESNLTVPVAQRLKETLTTVETTERTVEKSGVLSGVRWTARTFEIELDEEEGVIRGAVPLSLRYLVRDLFDTHVSAVLVERTVKLIDGTESQAYSLIDLRSSDSDTRFRLPGLEE